MERSSEDTITQIMIEDAERLATRSPNWDWRDKERASAMLMNMALAIRVLWAERDRLRDRATEGCNK